jgi:hypothetical protein
MFISNVTKVLENVRNEQIKSGKSDNELIPMKLEELSEK